MSVGLLFFPHASSSLDNRRKGWSFSTLPETMRERLQELQNTLADWLKSQSPNKAQSVLATVDRVPTLNSAPLFPSCALALVTLVVAAGHFCPVTNFPHL